MCFSSSTSVLLLVSVFCSFCYCTCLDITTSSQFMSDAKNESHLSENGNYRLGFFSPQGSLDRITGDGRNLAVFAGIHEISPLQSSNVSMSGRPGGPGTKFTAKLLSTGNLVLLRNKLDQFVWQSFDYPTDTVLPGMKFGMDRRTGLNRVLIFRKSVDNPAPGEFSAGVNPIGSPQFFVYKNLVPCWRCGPWSGLTLSGLPIVATRLKSSELDYSKEVSLFSFNFANDKNEVSLTFGMPNASVYSILYRDSSGNLERKIWYGEEKGWVLFWQGPLDRCDGYAHCSPATLWNPKVAMATSCPPGFERVAPSGWLSRCVDKKKMYACGRGKGEGFIRLSSVKLPDARTVKLFQNLTLQECENACLKSCNCTGYASADISFGGHGCFAWYSELNDTRVYVNGQDLYIRVDAQELDQYFSYDYCHGTLSAEVQTSLFKEELQGSRQMKRIITIIALLVALAMLLLISCCFYLWRKHTKRRGLLENRRYQEMLLQGSVTTWSNTNSHQANNHEEGRSFYLILFDLNTIKVATDNFSPTKKLGEGGFEPVFKML